MKNNKINIDVSCNCENFKAKEPKQTPCIFTPFMVCSRIGPGCLHNKESHVYCSAKRDREESNKDKASEAIKSIREIANEQLSELYEGFIIAKTGIIEKELKAKDKLIANQEYNDDCSADRVKSLELEIEELTECVKNLKLDNGYKNKEIARLNIKRNIMVVAKDKEIELITSDSKGILAIMESQRKSMRDKDTEIARLGNIVRNA